jgi:hypothetical protein
MKGSIVYLHRNAITGEVFYVGVGANRGRAYEEYNRSEEWYEIVDKYYFNVEILHHSLSKEEAFKIENLLINKIGLDNLVNKTLGGYGINGYRHSDSSKLKISNYMKNKSKEDYFKACRKGAETRRNNKNEQYKHIDSGNIYESLPLGCLAHNIDYKAEWQRQYRNSFNKNFCKIDNNDFK